MKDLVKNIVRVFIVLASGYGVAMITGLTKGKFNADQLVYYTILSNLIICAAYAVLLFKSLTLSLKNKKVKSYDFSSFASGALTLMILVTGLVYNFVLAPTISDTGQYSVDSLSNFLVHSFVPIAVFADWILFENKSKMKKYYPFVWLAIPLIYWIFTIIRASFGYPLFVTSASVAKYYPYFFIEVSVYGWGKVILNVAILIIGFLIFGFLMYSFGRFLDKKYGKKETS